MKTQIEYAKDGTVTSRMKKIAKTENVDPEVLKDNIAEGKTVIMARSNHLCGIGCRLTTKINVNIGTSSASIHKEKEVEKARVAEVYGADTITDLSMGGDITGIRRQIQSNTSVPLTTVPIYQCVAEHSLNNLTACDLLAQIEEQVKEGISSIVLHFITPQLLRQLKTSNRVFAMVSKGGSFTSLYMIKNNTTNPYLEHFDEILQILKEKDVVLSLGNTLRSGCVYDTPDEIQKQEIELNAALAKRANDSCVQVIIEGMGGHMAPALITKHVRYQKQIANRPLFVSGPLPTDIAIGYDHIAASIGAAMASGAGADYLCMITPAEHLCLPDVEHIKEGLIAFKIAAHIGDSIKYSPSDSDKQLAIHRSQLDWERQLCYAIEPLKPRQLCPRDGKCTMCGKYCAVKTMKNYLEQTRNNLDCNP
ncbi:MAG: Phosphomethylpyrimidine synthase [Candidatus Argoarchaeum ethanivorans]|uniref:Phosphomethylpyrimidine synthase n=1 Tax=Candidatus Argoarchaeum ethanivorans TaxID=2608793 RepID=A0A811TEV8_9EURY|nr:MAG: Phosphomethylpyrimidine synthase [Candidatus Argoarchaeum ethanivorans]